jgi:hypothetical protein
VQVSSTGPIIWLALNSAHNGTMGVPSPNNEQSNFVAIPSK